MALASRGLRDMDGPLQRLGAADASAVLEQARRIHRRALAATAAYIIVTLLLP